MNCSYGIQRGIAILGSYAKGTKELNLIRINNKDPKYDIRAWEETEDGTRTMRRGITLTRDEALKLRDALNYEFRQEDTK